MCSPVEHEAVRNARGADNCVRSMQPPSRLPMELWTGDALFLYAHKSSTAHPPTLPEQDNRVDFAAHRTQALNVGFAEREPPPPHEPLNELPVRRLVGGAVAAVEVLLADRSLVVLSQARPNHVPVGDLSLRIGRELGVAMDCFEAATISSPPDLLFRW